MLAWTSASTAPGASILSRLNEVASQSPSNHPALVNITQRGKYRLNDENMTMVSCGPCKAGYFSAEASEYCSSCPPGQVSSAESASCAPCPAGTFENGRRTSCLPCAAGTHTSSPGQQRCTPCYAGGVVGADNKTCADCKAGKYEDGQRTICLDCSPGKISGDRATGCDPCKAGEVSTNNECKKCEFWACREARVDRNRKRKETHRANDTRVRRCAPPHARG